jgi:SAM-dependent methyltransferase
MHDWERRAEELAAQEIAAGRPTAWFDRVYEAGWRGDVSMPWDRTAPNAKLVEWARRRSGDGTGHTAVVVGCGLGQDSEFIAGLGYTTTAFDVAETPIRIVRGRFPDSAVRYVVADLLNPPAEWVHGFDLVVESFTVQALPVALRADATRAVARLVAPGGTLVVIAVVREDDEPLRADPPWPLTRDEIDGFAIDGLAELSVDRSDLWLAEFRSSPGAPAAREGQERSDSPPPETVP